MSSENPDHYKYMPKVPGENSDLPAEPPQLSPEPEYEEETSWEEELEREERLAESGREEDSGEVVFQEEMPLIVRLLYEVLGPYVVPTVASLFIFLLTILKVALPGAALPYSLTVFGATCIVPAIVMVVLLRVGAVSSFSLYDRKERMVPYLIGFLALGATTLFFVFKGAGAWIWTLFLGGTIIALANFLLNFKIRISNHCSAAAALLAVLLVLNHYALPQVSIFWWTVGALGAIGFNGTVAILYGRHTIWDVLCGYATGFLGVILCALIR